MTQKNLSWVEKFITNSKFGLHSFLGIQSPPVWCVIKAGDNSGALNELHHSEFFGWLGKNFSRMHERSFLLNV